MKQNHISIHEWKPILVSLHSYYLKGVILSTHPYRVLTDLNATLRSLNRKAHSHYLLEINTYSYLGCLTILQLKITYYASMYIQIVHIMHSCTCKFRTVFAFYSFKQLSLMVNFQLFTMYLISTKGDRTYDGINYLLLNLKNIIDCFTLISHLPTTYKTI